MYTCFRYLRAGGVKPVSSHQVVVYNNYETNVVKLYKSFSLVPMFLLSSCVVVG